MVSTGFAAFSTTVDKTNRILKDIESGHGWPPERRNQSYGALRAVLHALRDRLSVEEGAQFAAQLPMLVRGIYYEGWDPNRVSTRMTTAEFLQRVRRDYPFELEDSAEQLVRSVAHSLRHHVSEGEWSDIRATLPSELASALA